jgi:NADH-quinone oxidoreductase subunit M
VNAATFWLILVLAAPLTASAILVLLGGRAVRAARWVAGAGASLPLAATLLMLPALQRATTPSLELRWVPAANIALSLRLDWLALPFLFTEAAVTLAAVIYAWGYLRADDRQPAFYALLLLFSVGMSGTTLANDMFLFYIFWELMLVASCALIALWGEGERRTTVALKYFIFTHFGSLMVLVGLLILYDATGSDSFSALRAGFSLTPHLVTTVSVLFIIGFSVKMAIFPLHLWLPDAHALAPMPVTIMLAAAMLNMGAYGILRFPLSIFSAAQVAAFGVPMMIAGIVSAAYGALMALAEVDIKRIIAYSSVSQMGYILYGLGTLTRQGIAGATLHVVFHAIVKGLLFMCVGQVIRATARRRVADLGGLMRKMPVTAACATVGLLAIAGTPPLCIFDSEWLIFAGGFDTGSMVLPVLALLVSLLTVGYALWFGMRVFLGSEPEDLTVNRLPWAMVGPAVFLAALALIEGLTPAPVFNWVDHALGLIMGGSW